MRRASAKKGETEDKNLLDLVFSWSLGDIFNEELYKDKVEQIPNTFQSVEQYLGSYVFPLLEETRAELSSSMEIIEKAPFGKVIALEEMKPYGGCLYDAKVDCWKNSSGIGGKEPYKSKPGDILVLSDRLPEMVSDLQRCGWIWTLASITKVPEDDSEDDDNDEVNEMHTDDVTRVAEYDDNDDVNEMHTIGRIMKMHTSFQIRTSKAIEAEDGMQNSLFAIFLMNITTNNRIWNALLHMFGNLVIIKKILSTNYVAEEFCSRCSSFQNNIFWTERGLSFASFLNESQSIAIKDCVSMVQCKPKATVKLIWGPPGTGKTKTVSMLLWTLLRMNCRTLSCAPTNIAIVELASRVMKLVCDSFGTDLTQGVSVFSLGQILLFGNKDRMKLTDDLKKIHLDYRVKRLIECFGRPPTHWKNCFTSMIDFLEDCVPQYHMSLEIESRKEEEIAQGNENKTYLKTSFHEFMRMRYHATALPLKRCVMILCTHMSITFILEHNFRKMVSLIELIDSFGSLLSQDDVACEELEEVLSHGGMVEDKCIKYSTTLLCMKRRECLRVLITLRDSLGGLNFPNYMNKYSARKFCFQMASLFFCTASCSYKLHLVAIKPVDVLVVDEAAQLKECESTIPLQLQGVKHAILIGDECQLPAMVRSKISDEAGFGRSLFERLSLLGRPRHLLNIQYRMHPSISSFPNSKFYQNQILDAPMVQKKSYERHYLPGPMFGPYSFISITDGKEVLDDVGRSWKNMVEVAVVLKIIHKLYKAWDSSRQKLSIGIVSPYLAQVAAVYEKLRHKYENLGDFDIKVKSIDGFQGGEEDIIILSTVRSNCGGSVGFLANSRRTNVALTRARHSLWILGNGKTLITSRSIWGALVRDAKDRQCFFNADEDDDLAKAILQVKKELDQLDDLLNNGSVLFRNAKWTVLFSDNFRKSFRKLKSIQIQKSVINLLVKLSSGWRPKKINIEFLCESSSQLLKQFKVENLYLVCTIDIHKYKFYTQVLKVWDILPLEEIPKLSKRLGSIFGMYTDDYVNRCKVKCVEGDVEVPMTWVCSTDIVQHKILRKTEPGNDSSSSGFDGRSYVENAKVNESLILMKFYELSSDMVGHLLSGREGQEVELPFEVTDKEREIILFHRSTFILGRSGTGKTTVLTMKLVRREQIYFHSSDGLYDESACASIDVRKRNIDRKTVGETTRPSLRQIFVTVSPRLCHAVKYQISNLKSFTCRGGNVPSESSSFHMHDIDDTTGFIDIPDCFFDIPSNSYPLVITFQKFLMMLDGSIGSSFFEKFQDARKLSQSKFEISRSIALQAFVRKREVNYIRFNSVYWPHFNSLLTKKLDSSIVFTEIISHIKGGLQAGESFDGKLCRESYILLSKGRGSNLSKEERETVYDIFVDYEKKKLRNGDFDLADLVIDLHRRLSNEIYEGEQMDFVYIDEVQDLTMRQIALFKYICKNVDEGFVFSGDTAQTITRGIDFRFQDIRSLFYKEFILESRNDGSNREKLKGEHRISEIFHLNQNFRTHAGVLKLSQSVLDLLCCFFPRSIDALDPETSLIYGEAPILLESGNDENAIVTIFGNSGNIGGSQHIIGFGAEQVILVRDDFVRKEITAHVGKQALVLTIVECKGLEFQDVLLYNFFGSSPLKSQWRVVYEYRKEQNLIDNMSFPSFNMAKHNILCSELKQLYVAITRTRQRLWICENGEEFSKPMFDYWKKLCLVQVRKLDESFAKEMQAASRKEEWSSRGIKLFNEGNYQSATMCFERAVDTYREKWAKAAGLRAIAADLMHGSNSEMARNALMEAAEIYETIGMAEPAANCFLELNEFKRAGTIYMEQCGESKLEDAGDCFSLAGCFSLAAEVYARGNCFSKCLSVCTEGKLFEMGLNFIQYWKENVKSAADMDKTSVELDEIEQSFLEDCAFHFHELNDIRTMMKFVKAFCSIDSMRLFLRTWGYLDELVSLEEESGNFVEAACIARLKGDLLLEADMLEKAGDFKEASKIILFHVLANSFGHPEVGVGLQSNF